MDHATGSNRLGRDAATYALGGLAGKVAGVLLLPFLSRTLGPDAYGRFDILNTIAATVPVILSFGMDAAATRLSFTERWTPRRPELLGAWLAVIVTTMVLSGIVLMAGAAPIAELLFGAGAAATSIRWLALIVPLSLLSIFVLSVLRIDGRATAYAVTTGSALILNAGLTVALVLGTGWAVDAALAAWAIALGSTTAIAFAMTVVRPRFRSRDALAALARFGLPLVPALVIGLAAELVNRSVLLFATDAREVAYLSVGIRVASVVSLAGTAFLLAWQPRAYASALRPDGLLVAWRDVRRFTAGAVVVTIVLTVVAQPIVRALAGPDYLPAAAVVGLLALAAMSMILVQVVSLGSALALRSHDIAVSLSIGAVVSVALNVILASEHGAMGTAVAMTIGPGVAVVVAAFLARRHGPPAGALGRILGGASIGAAGVGLLTVAADPSSLPSIVAAVGASIAASVVLLGGTRSR